MQSRYIIPCESFNLKANDHGINDVTASRRKSLWRPNSVSRSHDKFIMWKVWQRPSNYCEAKSIIDTIEILRATGSWEGKFSIRMSKCEVIHSLMMHYCRRCDGIWRDCIECQSRRRWMRTNFFTIINQYSRGHWKSVSLQSAATICLRMKNTVLFQWSLQRLQHRLKRTSTVCWENPWFRNNISRYLTWIVTKEIATIKQYKSHVY